MGLILMFQLCWRGLVADGDPDPVGVSVLHCVLVMCVVLIPRGPGGVDEEFMMIESHLIVRDKVTRQCPQTTSFEEKGEPKRIRTEVPLLTVWPNRLTSTYFVLCLFVYLRLAKGTT